MTGLAMCTHGFTFEWVGEYQEDGRFLGHSYKHSCAVCTASDRMRLVVLSYRSMVAL